MPKKTKQHQQKRKKGLQGPAPLTGLTEKVDQKVLINGRAFEYRKAKSILSGQCGDIYVCNNNPNHVYALTPKEADGIKQEMLKKDKAHVVDRLDDTGSLVVSFQNMVIARTKHKGSGNRHPCIFCCNASSVKTQFDAVLCATTVAEEEKKQSERLRKANAPKNKKNTNKKKKPTVGVRLPPKACHSPMCYFPVCVYPACKKRNLSHSPEQETYRKAYLFLYNHMLKSTNDGLKAERDAIKKNAEILLPLSIPIVEDIVTFLETSPRLNPKSLREKLQDLSRAVGVFNNTHRYVHGEIMEKDVYSNQASYVDYSEDTTKKSEDYSETTNSETTISETTNSETTNSETTNWDKGLQFNENECSKGLNECSEGLNECSEGLQFNENPHNSWAKKLIDTTKQPFKKPLGLPPGFGESDDLILPLNDVNENLMVFPKNSGASSTSSYHHESYHERLERTNAFLKTTLQNVQENAVKLEQKSKEWERLYFAELAENQKLVSENQRLVSENCAIAAELEAGKKKLSAIQDFFLTNIF